ncbi:MAG: MBG domain-containing protein [Gemmiger formicilis]|uniref:MBG domain-containing protein n=1 Tax=Gemmiger formicilis TaxID=745368 RepID=UPI00399BB49A
MKKRVLSLFLAITLCLTLTPTGALAEESLPGQTVVATQETETPTPAPQKEEPTAPAENGADENASPASPDEKPTENTPAAPEKNPADKEPGKEPAAATGRDESKADGSPSDDDAAKVQNQLVMAAAAEQNEPTMEGKNELPALNNAGQDAAGGGIYVAPGSPTEGGGGTYISGEDTRTEIRCTMKPSLIQRSYDGTTDGGKISIDLGFTDGTNTFELTEGTGFTAKKTFDSADAGQHTVTVEIELIGEAAAKYKLKAGEETFTIDGYIDKAYPDLTVSLSKAACTVGEKILPLLSTSGVQENAAVTYYYAPINSGYLEFEGSEAVPAIDENTAISEPGTYYVYAKTAETTNYEEDRSATVALTVTEPAAASVTKADGSDGGTYKTLPAALDAAQDGDTVKLLADHTTNWDNVDAGDEQMAVVRKTLTLDLNGMTVDYLTVGDVVPDEEGGILESYDGNLTVVDNIQGGSCGKIKNLEFVKGSLTIQGGRIGDNDGSNLTCDGNSGTVTISGGTVCNATVGDGATVTVTGGTGHAGKWYNDGTLNITDGTFGNVKFRNNGGTIAISGGTFGTITNTNGSSSIPLMPLLADNYAFYQGDNAQNSTEKTLTNVTVRPHTHSFENGKCDCGASYVASVTTSNGVTTNYTSLDDALDAAKDGDTVKLLGDAEITKWRSLTAAITLDLNGKTITTQSKAELYIHAQVIVQDNSTGKNGGMAGTYLLNVQEKGDLIIQSGTFDGKITINVGKLTIEGGIFKQEVDLRGGDSDSVFFSGGTFTKLFYPKSGGSFLDLLADGYAFFYTKDSNLVNAAEISGTFLYNVQVQQHTHSFTDGACACGYTCPHTSVNENGVCKICNKRFAASVTAGEDVTYYDTFGSALSYATRNDGCTLKLLADVTGTTVMINNPFIYDLNGHSVDALSVDAKATIKDSGTTKGRIGKVTVSNEKVTDLTLGSLLEEGYAFKYGNGYWANDSYLQTTEGSFVTVEKAPIQSVNVYAKDKNNQEILTIAYGATGEVTLVSSCTLSETSGADLTYLWYKLEGAAATAPLEGATGANYTLPDNLAAGTHTYLLICTSGGYSKSAEITITVTPISLEGAEVTVENPTYNGQKQFPTVTVKLGDETLSRDNDYTVQVTKQTNAGSYKLTIKGGGNYSGEIKDVEWKIEPMKIDSVMVSSDISKVYDGTAEINMSANEWTTALKFKTRSAYDVVSVPSDAYTISDAYFVEKSGEETIHSPDAGEKYGITFKITLNDDNYVLQTYGEDTPSTSKVITQSGGATFAIAQADAPTNIQTGALNVINGTELKYTYDAKQLLPDAPKGTYGNVSYNCRFPVNLENGYYVDDIAIDDSVLTLTIAALSGRETGKIGTIPIYITTDNYESFELPLDLYAVDQIKPEPDGTITASEITYSDELSKSTISGKMKNSTTGDEVKGTFAWTDGTIKPAAGDYTAEWTFTPAEGYEEYATATGTVTVKVNKATPTFTAPTAQENLTYTGQEQALITAGMTDHGTMQYSLTENGTYSQDIPTGTDAGAYTVWYRVIGDANHNDTAPASVAVRIRKKPLTITGVTAASKPYDGTKNAGITSVTFGNVILNRDTDYNVTANFDDAGVGKSKNVTATVTLMGQAAKNYALEQSSFTATGSITKAAAPGSGLHPAVTVINDLAKTYEMVLSNDYLPKLSSPCEYGNVSYSLRDTYLMDGYKDTVQVKVMEENGQYKLKLTVPEVDYNKVSSVGTIDVRVTSDNYRDFYLTIGVKTKNKDVPVPDGTISASDITYGQALNDSKIAGKMKAGGKAIDGTFTWTNGTFKPAAGDYTASWTFTPAEGYEEYATATGTATVTVDPKAVTVSITPNGGSYGGTITPATATANDVVGEDAPKITLTYTGTANDGTEYNSTTPPTKAGTYTIKASTTNANYTLVANTATATFTVAKRGATVTPDNKSKVYQEKDPDLTYKVDGVLDGETLKGITLTRAEGENAGQYAITATADAGANPNYKVMFAEGTLTIEPKSIKGATVVLGKGLIANGAEQTQTVEKVLLDGKELPADSYTVAGNTATTPDSHTLTITAKGNYTGTVEQTYVIIPAKAEDAPGEEIAIGSGEVKVVVKSEGTVPPATLLTNKAELLAMLVDSGDITADELAQIADGANVDIALTVKEANVSAEIKTAMAQAAKGCTIGQYLDISLFKYMTVNGNQQAGVALHTTKDALTISVVVPDALINTNSAVNRTYCIVRNHEGTITVLDAAFDAASKTLTFKTDRFSDYAIAYKDTAVPSSGSNPGSNNSSNGSETKKNEVAAPTPAPTPASTSKPSTITAMPQTGDTSNPTLYVVLLVASLLGLAVVFVCKKRNDK